MNTGSADAAGKSGGGGSISEGDWSVGGGRDNSVSEGSSGSGTGASAESGGGGSVSEVFGWAANTDVSACCNWQSDPSH